MSQVLYKKLLLILVALTSYLYCNDDIEYWSNYELAKNVFDKSTLKIRPSFRFNNNISNHYWSSIGIGFNYKINNIMGVSIYYRPVYRKLNDNWYTEYRPYFDLNLKTQCIKLKIEDRSRIEYLNKKPKRLIRYRNKFCFGNYKIISNKLDFNLADEVFYDFSDKKINLNRIYINLNIRTYYNPILILSLINQQNHKENYWSNTIIIQTSIVYKI